VVEEEGEEDRRRKRWVVVRVVRRVRGGRCWAVVVEEGVGRRRSFPCAHLGSVSLVVGVGVVCRLWWVCRGWSLEVEVGAARHRELELGEARKRCACRRKEAGRRIWAALLIGHATLPP